MTDTIKEYITDNAITNAEQDNEAVDEFAKAMKEKLAKTRAKGRKGWDDKEACSDERLVYLFFKHLKKDNDGNFVDLANFLMFLHIRDTNPDILNLVKYLFKVDFEAELEEAIKPKSCLSCSSCCKDTQLLSSPPQYPLLCGIFKTVFINDFKQSCNRYEPKDNA